jgi:hypothetical protein
MSICHACGRPTSTNKLLELNDGYGSKVCPKCTRVCGDCGRPSLFLQTIMLGDTKLRLVCFQCAAKAGRADKKSFNYSPPRLIYHGFSKDNLFFGFENETIVTGKSNAKTNSVLSKILSSFPPEKIYCKFDGSIGGREQDHGAYGFEIVSHPHSFEELKKTDWSPLFHKYTNVDPTCGMHVHINKGAFTTFHLYKFLAFVHRNPTFIEFIAQRTPNIYCQPNLIEALKEDSKKKYKKRGPGDIYRRVQVNLCNLSTVELRFFSNVNTDKDLLKNIEFSHALYHFTRDHSKSEARDSELFVSYVKMYPQFYPNLISFLTVGEIN